MASSSPLGNSVIPIVNKLQDIFARLGSSSTIELPHVVGVTKHKSDDGADEEYGEFLHLPKKKFFDFSDIRREIQGLIYNQAEGLMKARQDMEEIMDTRVHQHQRLAYNSGSWHFGRPTSFAGRYRCYDQSLKRLYLIE
ncbi:hypothetical protein MKW98_019419, partial [Papaver atlanticum]